MKKVFALLLCLCVCFSLCGIVCVSAESEPAPDIASVNATSLKPVNDNGTLKLPEVASYSGFAFRGFFTEPEGQGTRVTATGLTAETVMYPYYTPLQEIYEYEVIAFGAYPYNHGTYVDTDGKTRDIGYRGSEEDFREMRDFGIDIMTIDYYHNAGTTTKDCDFNIKMCEQYDIDFFIADGSVMNSELTKEQLDERTAPYINSKNFRGFYIADEPGYGDLARLCAIIRNLQTAYPFADCHTNLISYELMFDWARLAEYYRYYYEHCNAFHICSDPYPYGNSKDENHSYAQYFRELQTIAKAAKACDRKLWSYAQLRNDFENDYVKMFYSIFSQFMFGTTGQVLFCYSNTHYYPNNISEYGSDSTLYNGLNNRADVWYIVRDILKNIRSFEDVFEKYAWDNAGYTVERSDSQMKLYKGNLLKDMQFEADDRIVISEFTEKNGSGAAVALLNDTTYTRNKTVHFSFTVPGSVKATVYYEGDSYELIPDENGVYTVDIPTWMGMYITFDFYEA